MKCSCFPLEKDGFAFIPWIGSIMGDCIYNSQEQASVFFAYSGTISTMISLIPQIYLNYKRQNMDGLALGLLTLWAFGDISNLMGALLTNQLPSQIVTAWLFISQDVFICCQYAYYEVIKPALVRKGYIQVAISEEEVLEEEERSEAGPILVGNRNILANVIAATSLPSAQAISILASGIVAASRVGNLPSCDARPAVSQEFEIIGYVLAWISGLLYFSSRIPQIIKNHRDRSVKGLSYHLFILAILGNLGYGVSVLLRLPVIDRHFYLATLPYLVGSLGVLLFDLFILMQSGWFGGF
jgi:uncharacterized protein with PQ loop repeat